MRSPACRRAALHRLHRIALLLGIPCLLAWALDASGRSDLPMGTLLGGCALSAAAMLCHARRFRGVLGLVGIELARRSSLRLLLLALFYQCLLPGGAGGDLTKLVKLRQQAIGGLHATGGIVLDHLVGLSALTLLVLLVATADRLAPLPGTPSLLAWSALPIVCLVLAAAWLVRHRAHGLWWSSARFGDALASALAMHGLLAAAVWTCAHACGVNIDYLGVLGVLAMAAVVQAVPLQLAGIGLADVAGAGLYLAHGLPPAEALLLSALLACFRLLLAACGGLWALWPSTAARRGTSVPAQP